MPQPNAVTYRIVMVNFVGDTSTTTMTIQRGASGRSPVLSSTSVTSRTFVSLNGPPTSRLTYDDAAS